MQYFFQLSRVYNAIHLISIYYSSAERNWSFPNHRHTIFEFKHCLKGKVEIKIDGISHIITAGESVFMKAGAYHQLMMLEDSVYFGFHFDIEMPSIYSIFQSIPHPIIDEGLRAYVSEWLQQFLSHYGEDFEQLHHLPNTPVNTSVTSTLKALKMHSSFVEFLYTLAEFYHARSQETKDVIPPSHKKIAHQVAFELNNTDRYNLQIGEIAKKLNLHRAHITNCFKEVYGMTPKQYLMQLRTQKAKQWLTETDQTVEEIADSLMFSSPAHFTKYFIQQTGSSPSHYRAKKDIPDIP
ncbi:AraC family transcriptional regulator [Paenibacillus nasutitermitis]|uniref:AraC family transcriptional regulator n=1 Tax=Paenibacillus nasutitermitis TaxID=1652958 RepID=A0A916Z4Y5_9BACL|nr:helix-turn-helix domain-containing protein [Paenibacillus nasutitermitis]GGD76981.1 AraC family transcriptional regulator [Paenibacillus nasutitermitis]